MDRRTNEKDYHLIYSSKSYGLTVYGNQLAKLIYIVAVPGTEPGSRWPVFSDPEPDSTRSVDPYPDPDSESGSGGQKIKKI
jgi:hypothetical protein